MITRCLRSASGRLGARRKRVIPGEEPEPGSGGVAVRAPEPWAEGLGTAPGSCPMESSAACPFDTWPFDGWPFDRCVPDASISRTVALESAATGFPACALC